MDITITPHKKPQESIKITLSGEKPKTISGEDLFALITKNNGGKSGGRFPPIGGPLYHGVILKFNQLPAPPPGLVQVTITFNALLYETSFTIGWKTKTAEMKIGGECFRIEVL